MEDIKLVDRKQIHWKEIQEKMKAEGYVFTVRRKNDDKAQASSGMGRIERISYTFLLTYDGSAILTLGIPKSKRKQAAIDRLVSLISEHEEANLTRFPLFKKMIPSMDTAMRLLPGTREQLPLPRPNLKYRVVQFKTLNYEWGCPNCVGKMEWLKEHFAGVEEFAI